MAESLSPPEPPTRRGRETRERIVAGAAELVYERGEAEISIRAVKEAAGVSGSQMTHYFPDRDPGPRRGAATDPGSGRNRSRRGPRSARDQPDGRPPGGHTLARASRDIAPMETALVSLIDHIGSPRPDRAPRTGKESP
jgi:hypothetical protein